MPFMKTLNRLWEGFNANQKPQIRIVFTQYGMFKKLILLHFLSFKIKSLDGF